MPLCLNFRVITATVLGVRIFRSFTVVEKFENYPKCLKNLDTQENCCNNPKIWIMGFVKKMPTEWQNIAEPDQTDLVSQEQSDLGLHC